ncbi:MAG: hypothetical protein M1393_05745 [Candidatus Thermoplasmatota archaeon]|nr:hypothetical protein [Candidatus Thermoplasmatota archaeon]
MITYDDMGQNIVQSWASGEASDVPSGCEFPISDRRKNPQRVSGTTKRE